MKLRRLAPKDLDAVVAIDAALTGNTRRVYFERRLQAALRQPELHVQFAAEVGGRLGGHVLARKLVGEFGRAQPALQLETLGVQPGEQGHGVGMALLGALEAEAKKQAIPAIRTAATWRNVGLLRFFDHAGFELAHTQSLECVVHRNRLGAAEEAGVAAPEHHRATSELDYSPAANNDFEALARDKADVRSLEARDLDDIVRIDAGITGRDRRDFISRLVNEAMTDSAVRVSLTARIDGIVAGYVAARTDFGDFGRSEPVAVFDSIGVDPDFAHQHVGAALLSQLFINLEALNIERVDTVVDRDNFELLGFLYKVGFVPSPRLGFVKRLS